MEESLDRKKKDWLVRSSMKILGPFDFDEVVDALLKHHISIIDEIRNSHSSWIYIRDHEMFSEWVFQLRSQQENSSETTVASKTSTGITKTKKIGLTRTDITPVSVDDDLTPLPSFETAGPVIKDITPIEEKSHSPSMPRPHKADLSAYGSSEDRRLMAQFKSKQKLMYVLAAVLVVAIVGGAWGVNLYRKNLKLAQQEELQTKGRLWVSQGFYSKALDAFKMAQSIAPLAVDSDIQLAFLYIRESLPVEAKRIFEKYLAGGVLNKDEISVINNGLGLASLKESDFLKANDYFEKALAFNPNNIEAKLNTILLKFQRQQFSLVLVEALDFVKRNSSSRVGTVLLGMAANQSLNSQGDQILLQDIWDKLGDHLSKTHENRDILALQYLGLSLKSGDDSLIQKGFESIFKINPFTSSQYALSLYVDQTYLSWGTHAGLCYKTGEAMDAMKSRLMRVFCLLQDKRETEALKSVEEYLYENPQDPYALTLKAAILYKFGKNAEAMVVIQNNRLNEVPMAMYVALQACMESDDARCAMENATAIYALNKIDSFGLYGMAWSLEKQKKLSQAMEYLSLSLRFDPNFLPAIEMQERLEGRNR